MLGWLSHSEDRPDVKINVICPATDVHIRKVVPLRPMITIQTRVLNSFFVQYSTQQVHIVRETPALYERIVRPYMDAFPASRTQWFDPSFLPLVRGRRILR
jgi:m7GpppX diphosphatase